MLWIGLSGGIASGKSEVSQRLQALGYPVIDADKLAHKALFPGQKGYSQVLELFGDEVLNSSGEIDRTKLGKIVFSDKEKLFDLENIIHPLVQDEVQKERKKLESSGVSYAFYDVPLLFEKDLMNRFDTTVLVYCKREQQIQRMQTRNQWSEEEIQKRLSHQKSMEDKKEMADYVLENTGTFDELDHEVKALIHWLHQKNHQAQE